MHSMSNPTSHVPFYIQTLLIISELLDDKLIPKIDADNVQFLEVIGGGGQGIVQKALWKNQQVAIKSLPIIDSKLIAGFLQEIKLLRYQNINIHLISNTVIVTTNIVLLENLKRTFTIFIFEYIELLVTRY
jgi:NAD kinase